MAATEISTMEMGEVGKVDMRNWVSMAKDELHGEPECIISLENCASLGSNQYIRD